MTNVLNLPGRFKVIPCYCGCYHFYINQNLIAVCQGCEHEMIIKSSEYARTVCKKRSKKDIMMRALFFICLGSSIGWFLPLLPDYLECLIFGLLAGAFFGYGGGLIYLHKKGLLR